MDAPSMHLEELVELAANKKAWEVMTRRFKRENNNDTVSTSKCIIN